MDLLLATGFTLRLTRFFTQDHLGEWWLVGPAKTWAAKAEQRAERWAHSEYRSRVAAYGHEPGRMHATADDGLDHDGMRTWQAKLVSGLDCPFCVGFWAGAAVLLSLAIVRAVPPLLPAWRLIAGAFALNYITGHVSSRLDG